MILKNLSASDFYDEEDLKGLKRLEAVPGIKKFVAETISNLREKYTSIEMCGDGINVTKEGYPHLFNLLEDVSVIEISDDGTIKIVRDGSSIPAEAY